jgi:hypothetical protein
MEDLTTHLARRRSDGGTPSLAWTGDTRPATEAAVRC